MYENLFLFIIGFLCIAKWVSWCWSRRKLYMVSLKLPGPLAFPIIGAGYKFLFVDIEDSFMIVQDELKKHKTSPIQFWLGPNLMILVTKATQAEKILVSTKLLNKPDIYDSLKIYAGEGLISGSGIQWKVARKHVQPLYGQKFVAESIGISNKHINRFMEILTDKVDQPEFDISHEIHLCVADVIGEAVLGTYIGAQKGMNKPFLEAHKGMYDNVYSKIVKPWLQVDAIFNLTEYKAKEIQYTSDLHNFVDSVAENVRKARRQNKEIVIDNFKPSINELDQIFMENSKILDYKNYLDNLLTLYAASEDTVAHIAAATCYCFGMYPEYQNKAAEEIQSLVGINTTNFTYDDINKLTYLDQCVKETLRLFPIAPFIARKVVEDFTIDNVTLPPNVTLMISIFSIHFDPTEWSNPMDFHPDHFAEESVEKRHPYSFIPFSSGPRGCIGKLYAYASIKVILINILQRFKIEAQGKYSDIYKQLKADISVRSKIGFPVKLTRRKWNATNFNKIN